MRIGIHVGKGASLDSSIAVFCGKYKFSACQIFTIVPQQIKFVDYDPEKVANVIKLMKLNVWIHSSYLISPWGSKPYNMPLCIKQLKQQVEMGACGVVFHLPKMSAEEIVPRYKELLNRRPANSTVVLENKAVRPDPGMTFETPEKLNHLVQVFIQNGIPEKDIALCIDTAHLHCSGVDLTTYEDAKKWFSGLKYPKTVKLVHLNGNSSNNFTDKHVIAFDSRDKIWGGVKYEESGVRAIKEFCSEFQTDIILECDFANETKKALNLIKLLSK